MYILANQPRGTLYVGVTSDVVKRAWEHRTEAVAGFSKQYAVHRLVHAEFHATMEEAILREKRIKRWRREWKIELVETQNPRWEDLYPSFASFVLPNQKSSSPPRKRGSMSAANASGTMDSRFRGNDEKTVIALLTRPREDSEATAAELARRSIAVMIEPLLDVVPVDTAVDPAGAQGILATSANGIRALAQACPARAIPVWAVGDASARTARQLGYTRVESAGGDVDTLADLVTARCDPAQGDFLHAAGTVTAGDLSGRLAARGFQVRRLVLYEARTADALSPELTAALAAGTLDLALFFSPRTAATFATLAAAAGVVEHLSRVAAYGLSQNVARELAALPWRRLRIAAEPTQAALLAALDDDLGTRP